MGKLPKIKGTTFDHEGFDKAIKERWKNVAGNVWKCIKHDTFFEYHIEDGPQEGDEPCWQCHNEFEKEL